MAIVGLHHRVFLNPDGTVTVVPPDIDFTPTPGMAEVQQVRDIDLSIHLGEIVTAKVLVYPHLKTAIPAHAQLFFELDGEKKQIKSIEFEDGSKWDAPIWPDLEFKRQAAAEDPE